MEMDMKTTLYYFTGTGNSLAITKDLAGALENCKLTPMIKMFSAPVLPEADAIGLIFPVYFENLPLIVEEFVRTAGFEKYQYIFGIATHNGSPGNALFNLQQLLHKKGVELAAGFEILMHGNMITMIDYSTQEPEQEKRIRDARLQVKQIAAAIRANKNNPAQVTYRFKAALTGKANYWYSRKIYKGDNKFWKTAQCTQCGICEKICPRESFALSDGIIQLKGPCEQCLACLHWCPKKALQNGRGTIKRRRYHHPDVSVQEMLVARQSRNLYT